MSADSEIGGGPLVAMLRIPAVEYDRVCLRYCECERDRNVLDEGEITIRERSGKALWSRGRGTWCTPIASRLSLKQMQCLDSWRHETMIGTCLNHLIPGDQWFMRCYVFIIDYPSAYLASDFIIHVPPATLGREARVAIVMPCVKLEPAVYAIRRHTDLREG